VSSADRVGLATRAFFLATVLGLALAFGQSVVLQGTVFLFAVSGLATAAGRFSFIPLRVIALIEGFLVALLIGVTLPEGAMLLPYLMVPPLVVGTMASIRSVVLVAGLEVLALTSVLLAGGAETPTRPGLELAAPWIVASLGAGLMAAWIVQLRGVPGRSDEASYESARRLLSQLRTVARRLSSGLDPVSMAEQMLSRAHVALQDAHSAVFVRTEGGVLAPLGYRGHLAQQKLLPEGHLIDICWAEMEPVHGIQPSGLKDTRHRIALPLRSGSRMIGVVVAEAPEPPEPETLALLMQELDEQALRLDTALVFDEVRALATIEERQRLAREIHDGVAQEIASLGYLVDDLSAGTVTEAQRAKLQDLRGEISRVVSELRLSIFDLRSEISPAAGLGSALSDYVRAVGARSGLTVHLTLDEAPTRLRSEVEAELLRIAQEAVTNARKHSNADNLWVDCRVDPPFAQITIQDDGGGLGQPRDDSYGLRIMRERAQRVGAALEVDERSGLNGHRGTRVAVTVGAADRAAPHDVGSEAVS
jgi:signal transduction histidine kinase